ncbi:MAG: hypothetical protein M3Z85_15680, partial [Acidobacteriota bacterium]|nr:hypothetical protein [Acidobacteriota bacterium]
MGATPSLNLDSRFLQTAKDDAGKGGGARERTEWSTDPQEYFPALRPRAAVFEVFQQSLAYW